MADVNQFLKAALEKQKLKEQKIEAKTPSKITKGVRPYNFDNTSMLDSASQSAPVEVKLEKPTQQKVEIESFEQIPDVPKNEFSKIKTPPADTITSQEVKTETNHGDIKFVAEEYEESYSSASRSLSKGFTRLPNEILLKIIAGEYEPRESKVLLALVRLSSGFGKSWVSVSAKYLADITNIPINHLFKIIKSLSEKGAIEKKANSGNERKLSNQYRVLFDGKNSFLDYSQAETGFSSKIENYLSEILVKTQREIEKKAIRELTEAGYNQEEIFQAIKQVMDRGMPGSHEKPNNPAAFLTKAGNRVFEDIRRRNTATNSARQVIQENSEAKERAEIEYLKMEEKFLKDFPEESVAESKINEIIDSLNLTGSGAIKVPYFVARKLAIQKWNELNQA